MSTVIFINFIFFLLLVKLNKFTKSSMVAKLFSCHSLTILSFILAMQKVDTIELRGTIYSSSLRFSQEHDPLGSQRHALCLLVGLWKLDRLTQSQTPQAILLNKNQYFHIPRWSICTMKLENTGLELTANQSKNIKPPNNYNWQMDLYQCSLISFRQREPTKSHKNKFSIRY